MFLIKVVKSGNLPLGRLCVRDGADCIEFPEPLRAAVETFIKCINVTDEQVTETIGAHRHQLRLTEVTNANMKASTTKVFMTLIEWLARYNVCDASLFNDRGSQRLVDHGRHHSSLLTLSHARECIIKAFEISTIFSSERDRFLTSSSQPQQLNRISQPFTSNLVEKATATHARHSSISPLVTPAKQLSRIGPIATPSKRPLEGMGQESAAKRVRAASPPSNVPWSEMPSSPTPWSSSSFQAQLLTVDFTMEKHGFVKKDMMNYLRHFREGGLWCRCRPRVPAEFRTANEDGEVLKIGEGYWGCHIKKSRKTGVQQPCGFWLEHKKLLAIQQYLEDHDINLTQDERYLIHDIELVDLTQDQR